MNVPGNTIVRGKSLLRFQDLNYIRVVGVGAVTNCKHEPRLVIESLQNMTRIQFFSFFNTESCEFFVNE